METVFSLIEVSIKLLSTLYQSFQDSKEKAILLQSLQLRVQNIHHTLEFTTKSSANLAVYNNVAARIASDFTNLNTQLQDIVTSTRKASKVLRFFHSSKVLENLKEIKYSLDALERHLDTFGLLKDIRDSLKVGVGKVVQEFYVLVQTPAANCEQEQYNKSLQILVQRVGELSNALDGRESLAATADSESDGNTIIKVNKVADEALDKFEQNACVDIVSIDKRLGELMVAIKDSGLPLLQKNRMLLMVRALRKRWYLRYEDIELERGRDGFPVLIGEGVCGAVYKGVLHTRNEHGIRRQVPFLVAAKRLKIGQEQLSQYYGSILREIFFLTNFEHPCLVHCYGAFVPVIDDGNDVSEDDCDKQYFPPVIVTERMTCHLKTAISKPLLKNADVRKGILSNIAEGLAFLHQQNIVHRDIKPENVLLRIKYGEVVGPAKLSDFGVSKVLQTEKQRVIYEATTTAVTGTISCMPPEVLINRTNAVTRRSWDVWSFGLLICFVMGDKDHALTSIPADMKEYVMSGKLSRDAMEWANSIEDVNSRTAAQQCLNPDWESRAKIDEVLILLRSKCKDGSEKRGNMSEVLSSFMSQGNNDNERISQVFPKPWARSTGTDLIEMPLCGEGNFEKGKLLFMNYLRSGDRGIGDSAIECLRQVWLSGMAEAIPWVARCQQHGLGGGNWDGYIATLRKGHELGNVWCRVTLGWIYIYTRNVEGQREGCGLVQQALGSGDIVAQCVSLRYRSFVFLPQSQVLTEFLKRSFNMSQEDTRDAIRVAEQHGESTTQVDEVLRSECLLCAALYYGEGIGVNRNFAKALRYMRMSSDLGNADARAAFGSFYLTGKGVKKDMKNAFALLTSASSQGSWFGWNGVGGCFWSGLGVGKDYDKAFREFERGAQIGYYRAQFNLAKCYLFGRGARRDVHLASSMFKDLRARGLLISYMEEKSDRLWLL